MRKMILLLSLSLAFLGCEESGPAAKTTAAAPSSEIEAPIVDEPAPEQDPEVVNPKTVYFELTTSEPTQYEIVVYKWIDEVGYDTTAFLTLSGTTSVGKTIESFIADYPCKVLVFKQETSSDSQLIIKKQGSQDYSLPMSGVYWLHETFFY